MKWILVSRIDKKVAVAAVNKKDLLMISPVFWDFLGLNNLQKEIKWEMCRWLKLGDS